MRAVGVQDPDDVVGDDDGVGDPLVGGLGGNGPADQWHEVVRDDEIGIGGLDAAGVGGGVWVGGHPLERRTDPPGDGRFVESDLGRV